MSWEEFFELLFMVIVYIVANFILICLWVYSWSL